jgi:HlyD family secretion protein
VNRRRIAVNGVIVLALAAVGTGTYVSLAGTKPVPLAAGQVVTVARGTVVATVTASGNAKARSTVAQSLTNASGTVTNIYVHTGQHVKKGQRLLKVDDGSARDDVDNAESDLRSAQAQLQTATQGRTLAEQQQDQASVASAETALKNAKTSLDAAEDTQDLDGKQQDQLVHQAEKALDEAEHPSAPTGPTTPGTGGASSTSESTVLQARSSLLQAKQSRDATELKDRQSVASAKGQVSAAQRTLDSQQATVAVNDQPADADTVASAQTAVDKDEVALKQAKATVADATLRASVAGTVGTISAVKGQPSSSSSGSGSSGSSSSTSSGAGAASGAGGSTASTTSSTASSSTGLVEIVDTTHLQVTADVAEADIVKVRNGQPATAVFAASNKTVQGRVSSIDTTSTVTNNVVEYGVTITLDASAASLRVGQTATVTITTGTRKDALSVPTSALTRTGDRYTVLRRANAADSTVEVQTGLVGTTDTEITSGLNEGDQVVITLSTASTSAGAGGPRRGGG